MNSPDQEYKPRVDDPTPLLSQYAIDLTQKAFNSHIHKTIGRDEEINLLVECLCRRSRIIPIIVGPPGIGKRAIVEGLALRVVANEVPEQLKNIRIFALNPNAFISGSNQEDENDQLIANLFLEANQGGILIFLEDTNFLYAKSNHSWSKEIADKLNSAVINGNLRCICAVTFEAHQFLQDKPQYQNFQPLRINELSIKDTRTIISLLGEMIEFEQGVSIDEDVYPWIVDFAENFIRNRYFPMKAIDLLDQCVSYVIARNRNKVTSTDAKFVSERLIGVPLDFTTKIADLSLDLSQLSILNVKDTERLINRLNITLRGMDIHPHRPNLVVMLVDKTAKTIKILASMMAETLFGDPERIVTIDSRLLNRDNGLLWFLGYKSEFEGLRQATPIYRIAQMPWCVITIEEFDAYHPSVIENIGNSLEKGYITDVNGNRIFLSNAIVLLNVNKDITNKSRIGFNLSDYSSEEQYLQEVEPLLGNKIIDQIDLVCLEIPDFLETRRKLIEEHFLANLTERYALEELKLLWDQSFIDWLLNQQDELLLQTDLDRLAEKEITPLLIQYLPKSKGYEKRPLIVSYEQDRIRVNPIDPQD